MKADYKVSYGSGYNYEGDELIVCNYDFSNKIIMYMWYGISNKNTLENTSIGKWKIKNLKK